MTEQTVPVPFAFLVDVVDPVVDEKHLPLDVHAKPLLLIDDHQAEVGEVDVGPGQAMGADHDVDPLAGQALKRVSLLRDTRL